MTKKFLSLFLSILIFLTGFFSFSTLSFAEGENTDTSSNFEETLYARAAVLMDAKSGRVLFGKNENELLPMASTTKILTCIVALENGNLEDIVTVSQNAEKMPKVKLYMKKGEQYQLNDLLYSMMLESHNDTAVAIAEHIGGSLEGFASMMNRKAAEIGCTQSFFITPNGLDATANVTSQNKTEEKIHATTAKELAGIMSYCIEKSPQRENFLKITRTTSYSFFTKEKNDKGEIVDGSRSFQCQNHNAFLSMMDGALSGKTGFTAKAGYCYVGALQNGERKYVVVLLACGWPNHKSYKWSDTKKLMKYGLKEYHYEIFDKSQMVSAIPKQLTVSNGKKQGISGEARTDIGLFPSQKENVKNAKGILLNSKEKIQINIQVPEKLEAPLTDHQKVGEAYFYINDEIYNYYDIECLKAVEKIDFSWCFEKVFEKWNL